MKSKEWSNRMIVMAEASNQFRIQSIQAIKKFKYMIFAISLDHVLWSFKVSQTSMLQIMILILHLFYHNFKQQ